MTRNIFLRGGTTTRAPRSSMAVTDVATYVGTYEDTVLDAISQEDGAATIDDPGLFGEHDEFTIGVIARTHDAASGMIASRLRAFTGDAGERIEKLLPSFGRRVITAKEKIDGWKNAEIRLRAVLHVIKVSGLSLPKPEDLVKSLVALAVLFAGDIALVSVAFQILGLSDKPWIPGVGVTDDLHLAALAAVVLLVMLAHGAGVKLRLIEFEFEQRRRALDPAVRAQLPKPSLFDVGVLIVCTGFATFALWGVAAIRLDYLAMSGVNAQALPFLAVQIGILAAAIWVAYHYANPLKRQYHDAVAAVESATAERVSAAEVAETIAGEINAEIVSVPDAIANAGHHVATDRANALRQTELHKRNYLHAMPEPSADFAFARADGGIEVKPDQADLLVILTGLKPFTNHTIVSTDAVTEHYEKAVSALRNVDKRFRKRELALALNPKRTMEVSESTNLRSSSIETAKAAPLGESSTPEPAETSRMVAAVPTTEIEAA